MNTKSGGPLNVPLFSKGIFDLNMKYFPKQYRLLLFHYFSNRKIQLKLLLTNRNYFSHFFCWTHQQYENFALFSEKSDTVSTEDHVTTTTTAITAQQQQPQQPQVLEDQEPSSSSNEPEITIDLNDSVQRLEAKCAGVREELGRMALSETYMRTKQAQLKAKKKEMLAQQAMIRAELKEKEAAVCSTIYNTCSISKLSLASMYFCYALFIFN